MYTAYYRKKKIDEVTGSLSNNFNKDTTFLAQASYSYTDATKSVCCLHLCFLFHKVCVFASSVTVYICVFPQSFALLIQPTISASPFHSP
jgi:hypothetical protein